MIDLQDFPEYADAFAPILKAEKASQKFPSRPDRWMTTEEIPQLLHASLTAMYLAIKLTEVAQRDAYERGLDSIRMEGE